MGNRGGRLHTDAGKLGRARWRSKAWICCRLRFRNRHRTVMGQSYTELFFLDEATALAAGHRPCFECRRQDALQFARLFAAAKGRTDGRMTAGEMDDFLHAERLGEPSSVPAGSLPTGAMISVDGRVMLVTGKGWRPWSFAGYSGPETPTGGTVTCLTPPSICEIMRLGYRPQLHASISGS